MPAEANSGSTQVSSQRAAVAASSGRAAEDGAILTTPAAGAPRKGRRFRLYQKESWQYDRPVAKTTASTEITQARKLLIL
jgi:hypothetical protein